MAIKEFTDAGVLTIPGAYVQTRVVRTAAGTATVGVMTIIGEADQGPRFSEETNLADGTGFSPDQMDDVIAKYGSGPIVDAFREALAPADDPDIQGAFTTCYVLKTNASVRAAGTLPKIGGGTWSALEAVTAGKPGNLLVRTITQKTAETLPTTGAFTLLVPIANTNVELRANGGAALAATLAAGALPSAMVTTLDGLAGVAATGGADRGIIGSVTGTLDLTVVSGFQVTITRSVPWSVTPSVGDTLFISGTSVIVGAANANGGSYVVTAATSTTISATKLLDHTGAANQLTAPVNVGAQAIASTTADARAFSPVTVSLEAGSVVDGLGKSLEFAELTSASGRLSYLAYALSATPVTWVSTSVSPKTIASATEYVANINVARANDGVNEDLYAGGQVGLAIGYLGTTASAVIASGVMTITVTGGAGSSPAPITLADYTTIADLVTYLNTLTGFSAAAGTAAMGQKPATALDTGTFTFASAFGARNGRIKLDAYQLKLRFTQSVNVRLSGTLPTTGQPATATAAFLTGGSRGGSSDADFSAALDAAKKLRTNFVVPLVSNDAAEDIADGLTAATSTYTGDGVRAAARSHVLAMSTITANRPRQAFLSHRGTFASDKDAGLNMSSFRCAMTFQDVRASTATGVVQQRPWMGAVTAAAYQAAAFRRTIFNKGVNIVGAIHANGTFDGSSDGDVTEALDSGLLILREGEQGGWQFVSDQTTYTKDDSFYGNSIQAVYVGDVIGQILRNGMSKIPGQTPVDMSQTLAQAQFEALLESLRRIGLIAPSNGAPRGWINAKVKLNGPSLRCSVECKEATGIYFVPITVNLAQVEQG